jgi:GT2 family glycosyltransferase
MMLYLGKGWPVRPEFGAGRRFVSAEDADFLYRAWRLGEKLCYLPEMLVYHDHGRQTPGAELKLSRWYVSCRGAFYAKHIWLRDSLATRNFYWELRSSL